jgi:hypothetical protein
MKGNGKVVSRMVMEYVVGQTAIDMKGNGKIIEEMEEEHIIC